MRSASRDGINRTMRASGWLARMPDAFCHDVLSRCHLRSFSAGEAIFRTGDPPGGIYGLVSGLVSVNAAMPDAAAQMVHIGLPGAWTGEGCFMTGQPRRGELRAMSHCQMLHLPLTAMEELAAQDSRAIRAFGVISILGVDVLIRIIHDLQKANAAQRIASVLHRLSDDGARPVPVSQEQLAEATSASRKVVNASLRRFADSGWIEKRRGYRSVIVLDEAALREFAEHGDIDSSGASRYDTCMDKTDE